MGRLTDEELRMLLLIYQHSGGDTTKIISRKGISKALGLAPPDGERLLKSLTAHRLIRYQAFASLCITESGRDEAALWHVNILQSLSTTRGDDD